MRIVCEQEVGKWTIRIDGVFIAQFWRAAPALRMVEKLRRVLLEPRTEEDQ